MKTKKIPTTPGSTIVAPDPDTGEVRVWVLSVSGTWKAIDTEINYALPSMFNPEYIDVFSS